MSTASKVQKQMFDRIREHDLAGLRELYHAEYVYLSGDGVERRGADAGVEVAETFLKAFPDLAFDMRATYACGEAVSITELTVRGTHQDELMGIPPTGKVIEAVACNVVEVRDGKIYREREYYDSLTMLQQLGAAPIIA